VVTSGVPGQVITAEDFDPWGMVLDGRSYVYGNPDQRYKFTGKERDAESGYDYFGARYYDSRIGRWMSVDPLAEKYAGWSPYSYSLNDPVSFYDADGRVVVNNHANNWFENLIGRPPSNEFRQIEAGFTCYRMTEIGASTFDRLNQPGITVNVAFGPTNSGGGIGLLQGGPQTIFPINFEIAKISSFQFVREFVGQLKSLGLNEQEIQSAILATGIAHEFGHAMDKLTGLYDTRTQETVEDPANEAVVKFMKEYLDKLKKELEDEEERKLKEQSGEAGNR
jgi:RHS repeat-associated protein